MQFEPTYDPSKMFSIGFLPILPLVKLGAPSHRALCSPNLRILFDDEGNPLHRSIPNSAAVKASAAAR